MITLPSLDRGRIIALGWAAFVACSWTWCIGMYLPVLMIRDYGAAGWLVFAIPNILGAAALGWVLHKPGAAAELSRRHWPAAVTFSVVTILFHAFFVGWLIRSLIGDAAEIIVVAVVALVFAAGRIGRRDLIMAAILLVISSIAFVVAASLPHLPTAGPTNTKGTADLSWLGPICIFGFLLCPYLDLTFLRARASTESRTGIAAFTIGFGIFFLAMIGFTFWYARFVQPQRILPSGRMGELPVALAWIIAIHMMLQAGFTVALHLRAISETRSPRKHETAASLLITIVLTFLIGVWSSRLTPRGFNSGEILYRLFMGAYGLVFPAYVWLCMIPIRGRSGPDRVSMFVLVVTLLIAGPMFWLGFIGGEMAWLAPGLLIVLVSRMVLFQIVRGQALAA